MTACMYFIYEAFILRINNSVDCEPVIIDIISKSASTLSNCNNVGIHCQLWHPLAWPSAWHSLAWPSAWQPLAHSKLSGLKEGIMNRG